MLNERFQSGQRLPGQSGCVAKLLAEQVPRIASHPEQGLQTLPESATATAHLDGGPRRVPSNAPVSFQRFYLKLGLRLARCC